MAKTPKQSKPVGRPSSYTKEIGDKICERLALGESLRTICDDDDMPSRRAVIRWLASGNEPFRLQYAQAREAQADSLFDEILEIADDGQNDWMERRGQDDAGWIANGENIRRSQLRIDARKWMAGKLAAKKYGDKITNEHTGVDGGPIQVTRIELVAPKT